MIKLRWRRSADGYIESRCGRFVIEPRFLGRARPQYYVLFDGVKMIGRYVTTQREAREEAARRAR